MTIVTYYGAVISDLMSNFNLSILINIFSMKSYIYLAISLLLAFSCVRKGEEPQPKEVVKSQDLITASSEAYELLKSQCFICHSPVSSSHEVIIAPPMAAVKFRYSRSHTSKDRFIEAVVSYTMDPAKETALMKGAVERFGTMPKQPFQRSDMVKIASYIYDYELEEPAWFGAHKKEMHANGFGTGQGKFSKN